MKKRNFIFKKNNEEMPNFKICDLEFILDTYDRFEVITEQMEVPQYLIVRCHNDLQNDMDIWEVKEII